MLTLYTPSGTLKAKLEPEDSSRQTNGIQEDDVLSLSFTLYQFIEIDVNDYIDYWGTRYRCMQRTLPKQISTVEWKYDVTLYGPTSLIKRYLVINDGSVVFSLTGTPAEHLQLIIACINAAQPQGFTAYTVGTVDSTEEVTIDYNATYCNEALQQLAEQTEQEFWFQGTQVNLCKCEQGTEITLRYGQELTNLEREINPNQKLFTRLFPIGSTKNIPEDYGYDRLKLPASCASRHYLTTPDVTNYGNIDHAEETPFEDIYPVYVGEVGEVGTMSSADSRYFFRDLHLYFNPNNYIITGQRPRINFLTGQLQGLGDGEDGSFPFTFDYENLMIIITPVTLEDGTVVPGEAHQPVRGDRYAIENINTPPLVISKAENVLLERAQWFMEQSLKDISTYKAQTNHVLLRRNATTLTIGRRVKLLSAQYFPTTGYMQSRITRISRHINTPYLLDIEISEILTTSSFQTLAKKVDLTYNALIETNKKGDYDEIPETEAVEWNAEMGELPANHQYIILSKQVQGETIYLPFSFSMGDYMPYVIRNTSRYEKTINANGRKIYTQVYSQGTYQYQFVDSMTIGTGGQVVLFFTRDESYHEDYWKHRAGIPR